MLLMTGSTGQFFALVPKAVTFAIVASLFECIFILPLHYLDFGPRPAAAGTGAAALPRKHDDPLLRALRRLTHAVLRVTLRWRWTSLAAVVLAFIASVALLGVSIAGIAPLIRIKFFPDDYNLYYVFIDAAPGTPLGDVDQRVRAVSRAVIEQGPGYAKSAAGFAGFTVTEDYEQEEGHHLGTVMVALPDKGERAFDDAVTHLEHMRQGLTRRFQTDGYRIRLRAEKDGPPSGKDINIQVVGNDEAAVSALADAVTAALRDDPGLGPELIQLDGGRPTAVRVLRLEVDGARAREHGLTRGDAARLAAAVLDGRIIGDLRLADEEVDLRLGLDAAFLDMPDKALQIPVLEHPSGPVLLGDLVTPVVDTQPSELRRYRGQRSRTVTANLRPGARISPATVKTWAEARRHDWQAHYPGVALVFGGEYAETQRSYASLTRAFGLSVLVIYLILAAQFRSYVQPAIILSAVMFSIIGVVLGKLVTQSLFTVNSFIALVGVTGVVVNDALVLLDFINRGYRGGLSRAEAIRRGIDVRLRPILLTTLTTTLGLLPMALGIPSYSLIWGTMASTFAAGLATATLLTLFIVPVGWDLLMQRRERGPARGAPAGSGRRAGRTRQA
jgi:HAE1 family hydrophobic/amphiphilic exporter-1